MQGRCEGKAMGGPTPGAKRSRYGHGLAMRCCALVVCSLFLGFPATGAEIAPSTLLNAEQAKPWRGVGRVNIATDRQRGMCTGTLIAADVVLTAAHCLVRRGTLQMFAPADVHFVAGWHKGRMTGHSRAAAMVLHPGWTGQKATRIEDLGTDMALIRLRTPLGTDAAAPFATGRPGLPGDPVELVSYRRDRAHALSRQSGCRYRAVNDAVLTLDCNVVPGASGAPVFARTKDGTRIVAVLAAGNGNKAFAARADLAVPLLLELLPR